MAVSMTTFPRIAACGVIVLTVAACSGEKPATTPSPSVSVTASVSATNSASPSTMSSAQASALERQALDKVLVAASPSATQATSFTYKVDPANSSNPQPATMHIVSVTASPTSTLVRFWVTVDDPKDDTLGNKINVSHPENYPVLIDPIARKKYHVLQFPFNKTGGKWPVGSSGAKADKDGGRVMSALYPALPESLKTVKVTASVGNPSVEVPLTRK